MSRLFFIGRLIKYKYMLPLTITPDTLHYNIWLPSNNIKLVIWKAIPQDPDLLR